MRNRDFNYVSGKKYDNMMGRCYRPADISYANYGGRGIKVCSEWIKDINAFREWIRHELKRLEVNEAEFIKNSNSLYTLDRRDANKHYCPENCRLTSKQAQARNQRRRRKVIFESAEGEEISA